MLNDVSNFTNEIPPPNTDYFYSLDEINDTILKQLSNTYEDRLEKYFIPTNISVDVTFKDRNYNEVEKWQGTDNGALRVGKTLFAECLRYKYALDNDLYEDLENATRMVKKCVSALSDMIAAPNGGLGIDPDTGEFYPGTLSRFVCDWKYHEIHPWIFEENERHFNGTGDYAKWRVRLYTSRDEVSGYYLGWASVLKYINPDINEDSEWCVERVKLMVEQVIEGFKKTNWLILGGNGEPVGSDLNGYFEGSTWQLTLLRIGATALPEKYESHYSYCAAKMLTMGGAKMGDQLNAVNDYYALSFGAHTMFSLIILEDNPKLQFHYIENFEKYLYNIVKYHRNAYFNALHLAFMSILDEDQRKQFKNSEYDDDTIKWDVLDQLWRFYASGWTEGIRNYNLTDRPHSTRSTSLNPEINEKEVDPTKKEWREFFEKSPFGGLLSWVEFDINFDEEPYLVPLTVSETGAGQFFWADNPFFNEGGNPTGDGLSEVVPTSFTSIYWLGKAFDLF